MHDYASLKQFSTNLNKATRMLTDGKFNSSELAIIDAIKDIPKSVDDIANEIGMSKPTVHSSLMTNVRRKYIEVLAGKTDGHFMYVSNGFDEYDVLEKILEPLNQNEQKMFIDFINRINSNINHNILNNGR